jgi:hypothetical protein
VTRQSLRRTVPAILAACLALGLVAAPTPLVVPAVRAADDLTITADASYVVVPDEARVRVTVDLVATNHLRDTATRRYYFDRAFMTVQPGTTNFKITSESSDPSVRVSQNRSTHQVLAIGFGQRIAAGKSARFRLTFDLPDPGGAATREVRVGTALVAFPVWGVGYPNGIAGGTVKVTFPKGYTIQVEAGELGAPTTDDAGRIVLASGTLEDATAYFAYIVADRPGAYAEQVRHARVGRDSVELTIRSWPDDPDWSNRVGTLFERSAPELSGLIGLPWRGGDALTVQESVSRTTGGYAGLFDPAAGRIEVAYYADSFVVLHEAAHAWFNGSLLADRWSNEAFASYYAVAAGGRIDEPVVTDELTDELRAARIPLNAWGTVGVGDSAADLATEDYAYAASLALAREIAERAGYDGLRRVWRAAAAGTYAYQPPNVDASPSRPVEAGAEPPDWRGLLDLLEDHTSAEYADLWRAWVTRPEEADLLQDRAEAREAYDAVLRRAGRWELPASVRDAMRTWQFENATTLIAAAETMLDRRQELEAAASSAGLSLPTRLELAFESDAGFTAANAEADAEAAAIGLIVDAGATRPAAPDVVQQIGLLGSTPDVTLADARSAFARGELSTSAELAVSARETWTLAAEVGRNRILTGIGLAILAGLAILLMGSVALSRVRTARRTA